jgi:hypothetical protein
VDCIALYDSGNYAYRMSRIFEQQGISSQVISTPCIVAKTGCGYCLLFDYKYLNHVLNQSKLYNCPVKEVYKIGKIRDKNNYIKII